MALLIQRPSPQNFSQNDPRAWLEWAGLETESGAVVTRTSAMQMAVVWQCVNWRAKMYGHLPHKVLEKVTLFGQAAQIEAEKHPLYSIIHDAPNPTLTSAAWFGLISADLHLDGNSYAWIQRGQSTGRIQHLWRFHPAAVRLDTDSGEIQYYVRRADGSEQKFLSGEILHIRGLGYDGVRGYSPIALMREELGWALSTRKFSSKYYKNAFRPSGLLISPQAIKEPAKTGLLTALREGGKEGGLALIEGAMEYKPMLIPQNDAQFLETMQFQDERIAGIMEVYAHEIGIMREMTNNNIEQVTISSVTRNLVPFSVGVEQWMELQLLSTAGSSGRGGGTERERYCIRSNFNALMRGDTAAQTAHIEKMFDRGIYSGNDVAAYLGNAPYEGGDKRFINRAYGPVDMADDWSKVSQNNPPAKPDTTTPEPPTSEPAKKSNAFSIIFRDAVGRTIGREKGREKAVAGIFRPALLALSDSLGMPVTQNVSTGRMGFIEDYLDALSKRVSTWEESQADAIAESEVNRAIEALGRKK